MDKIDMATRVLADMEWKLQTARAINLNLMDVARYLVENRERLLPKLIEKAVIEGKEVDHIIYEFIRAVQQRWESGLPLS